jgi:hypothetical protein
VQGVMGNAYKGRNHTEDLGVGGNIILNLILGKLGEKFWSRFIWFRIGTRGVFL